MMPYKAKFSMIGCNELKYNSVGDIHPKAPDLMPFGMQLFNPERRMKWIVFKKFRLFYGFFPDGFGEFFEEFIEGFGSGYFHLFLKKLGK